MKKLTSYLFAFIASVCMSVAYAQDPITIYIDVGGAASTMSLRAPQETTETLPVEEPDVDITVDPTEETTAIPVPGAIGSDVTIKPIQEAEDYGGLWVIPLEEEQQLVGLQWQVSQPASEYFLYTLDEFGEPELYARTTENSIWLPAEDFEDGCNTLYVGAVLEDGTVTWGEAMFELIPFIDEPIEEPT